jgi:hypothetical protein
LFIYDILKLRLLTNIQLYGACTPLSSKTFVKEVAPTPASVLHKKVAQAQAEDDEDEESVEFEVGDTVGKVLAFVV